MASNKNQHFVPKAYLRAWTTGRDGKAINLLHVPSGNAVFGGPVRNQCSANYFYGQDRLLEDAIQTVEGAYAECVARLQADPDRIDNLQNVQLRRFIYLQHLRTEASARHFAELTTSITAMHPETVPKSTVKELMRTAVLAAMRNYAESMRIVDDLNLRIFRNETSVPFITSDDPAILLNRWHQAQPRNRHTAFGVGSAGAMLLLPLTPKLAMLLFDGEIYTVPHTRLFVPVERAGDARALNALQALNCNVSLYFDDVDGLEHAEAALRLVNDRRPGKRLEVNYAVAVEELGGSTRYDITDSPDFRSGDDMLVHSSTIRATPPIWPSVLRLKTKRTAWVGPANRYLRYAVAEGKATGLWRKVNV